jgi:hypothetical protein
LMKSIFRSQAAAGATVIRSIKLFDEVRASF